MWATRMVNGKMANGYSVVVVRNVTLVLVKAVSRTLVMAVPLPNNRWVAVIV